MGVDDDGQDETAAAEPAPENATAVVTSVARTGAAELAWSAEQPLIAQSGRRPLSMALKVLLASVGVGGLALGAFALGHRQASIRPVTPSVAAPAPSVTPTTRSTPTTSAPLTPAEIDAEFLRRIRAHGVTRTDINDAGAIRSAHITCDNLANYTVADWINFHVRATADAGMPWSRQKSAAYVMDSVDAYCPWYR